jgi:hypothetical protein
MTRHILTEPDPAFDFAPAPDSVLVRLILAQIEKEEHLTVIHRNRGDTAKMRAAMQTATVLRRILRQAEEE